MKAVCKKLFSLMLVAILLVSAVPFQALAAEGDETIATTVETTAAETEAAEPAAQAFIEETLSAAAPAADLEANSPSANAGVTLVPSEVYVHFQLGRITGESERNLVDEGKNILVVNPVKTKVGNKISAPGGAAALTTLAKALGNNSGYEFVRWYDASGNTFSNSNYLIEEMLSSADEDGNSVIDVYAEFKEAEQYITLNAAGGKVSSTKHPVKLHQPYDYKVALPTPTKANSEFEGWYKADGTLVDNDSIVNDLGALTAKWSGAILSVTYEAYTDLSGADKSGWATVEGYTDLSVKSNSVLTVADGTFPSDGDAHYSRGKFLTEEMYRAGWYIAGWKVLMNSASVVGDKTKVTESMVDYDGQIIIRPVYKRTVTLYKLDNGHSTRTVTVTLGEHIPALPNPGDYAGKAFMGWCLYGNDHAGTDYENAVTGEMLVPVDKLSSVSDHPVYYPAIGDLCAQWDEATRVLLYVHVNGNIKDYEARMFYDVPSSGFYLSRIDLYKVFPGYGKYDDEGDKSYGWYNDPQWSNYAVGKPATEFDYVTANQLEKQAFHEYHIMLIDNGNNASSSSANGNGYNTNASTADKTNPATGDQIFAAVTVMAISACALVFFLMKKKRASK